MIGPELWPFSPPRTEHSVPKPDFRRQSQGRRGEGEGADLSSEVTCQEEGNFCFADHQPWLQPTCVLGTITGRRQGREGSGCPVPAFPPAGHETGAGRYLVVTGQMAAFRGLVEADGHFLGLAGPRPHAGAAGSGRRAVERRHHGLESRTLGRGPRQQGCGVEG